MAGIVIKDIKRDLIDSISTLNEASSSNCSLKKEYRSLTRARAYCIMQMKLEGKISDADFNSKKMIFEIVKREFPGQSGQTLYTMLKTGKDSIYLQNSRSGNLTGNGLVIQNEDYVFGLKLFKLKYPDSLLV